MAQLLDESDAYAGRFVVIQARFYDTGVHGMFITDAVDSRLGIGLALPATVTQKPVFRELLRLLIDDMAADAGVIGTAKGVERYPANGTRVFELHDVSELRLRPR